MCQTRVYSVQQLSERWMHGMKMDVRKTYRQIAPSCHHCIFSNLHRGRGLSQRDRFRGRAYFYGGRQLRENICEKIITILGFVLNIIREIVLEIFKIDHYLIRFNTKCLVHEFNYKNPLKSRVR